MTTKEFVNVFYLEKQDFLETYLTKNSTTDVGRLIQSLELTEQQAVIMEKILDTSLNDIFYTVLLGLDGSTSIGGVQEMYDLRDERGNQLSGNIEEFAYTYFHNGNRNQ